MPTETATLMTMLDALEQLAFALVSVTSRALSEQGGQLQLTFQQWRALVVLGVATAPLRISDIARRIGASGPSTSRIVQRLQNHGLVEAATDRRDGRAVVVTMTAKGSAVRAAVVQRRRELIAGLVGAAGERPVTPEALRIVEALATAI